MTLGLGMYHLGYGAYQVCANDDPRLNLTYLTSRSNLLPNGKISEKLIFFKTVEALVFILTWYV